MNPAPKDQDNSVSQEIPVKRKRGHGDLGRTLTQNVVTESNRKGCELLVRLDSSNAGQVFSLNPRMFTIGRHPDSAACIDDQGLSRQHARISRVGDRHFIEDLGSSNGTFVNGQRIRGHELCNGDTLQLGPRVCFRYTVASKDEERVLKQLYESSVRDPLTQAFNRQYLASQLMTELSFAARHGTEVSLLMLDVDYFKRINDTYGHLAGDAVLKQLSAVVHQQIRNEDVFARYGGEEFVVLLRDVPLPGAAIAAERLRAAFEKNPIVFAGQTITATVSIGCASLSCCQHPNPDTLVQRADGRLYQAKRDGRNRCVAAD